ncbi:MAG TPA: YdcF family protein [Vicinamibacteria bacterium]|nr:YdcF family protein [Vicinamibacteria bacterium]
MSVDDWARTLWNYHRIGHALEKAECIIALGSHDTRVAERAAEVFLDGWAPLLVCSGHLGALTRGMWTRPEAEVFADVAAARGVPRDRILIESRSTNTGENVDFSRQLLAEHGLRPRKAIAVQKPYMERRTLATFARRWPALEVLVTSPRIDLEAYPTGEIRRDDVIHIMVGDLQRLIVYGRKGWSAPQDVPAEVIEAYERLVGAGYTRRLLAEERE